MILRVDALRARLLKLEEALTRLERLRGLGGFHNDFSRAVRQWLDDLA